MVPQAFTVMQGIWHKEIVKIFRVYTSMLMIFHDQSRLCHAERIYVMLSAAKDLSQMATRSFAEFTLERSEGLSMT